MSTGEPQPTCSGEQCGDMVTFRYEWPVKVCRRLIDEGDSLILNVSPAFSTSFNGVQFTWALRLSDECVASENLDDGGSCVNIFLYYKDGPTQDISILGARINIADSDGKTMFSDLTIDEEEYTRGSGWSANTTVEQRIELTRFVHQNVDKVIRVVADISINTEMFSPWRYLPQLDSTTGLVESTCRKFLKEVQEDISIIPDSDIILENVDETDPFAVHRHIFNYGLKEVELRSGSNCDPKKVKNVFANIYFSEFLVPEMECYEDFVDMIVGARRHHIPALIREAERYICREIIKSSGALTFVKKMMLLASRFQLPVVRMMCGGILADRLIEESGSNTTIASISTEMKKLVREINIGDDDSNTEDNESGDSLVASIVNELKILTKRMRRVSMSRSSSTSSGKSSTVASPCASPQLARS
ncbi:hypothetical protein AB6A40_006192 [Gnathostoma spinigerum]|uniref:BTB/POZ domain-containing protein n=1 Tax=Gnathostoma spinigerum TaxID=75299 RepID=A0ABD6ER44_9BILA